MTLAVYGTSLLSRPLALRLMKENWRNGITATSSTVKMDSNMKTDEGLVDSAQWFTALQVALLLPSTSNTNLPWRLSDVSRLSLVAKLAGAALSKRTKSAPTTTFMSEGIPFQKQVGDALTNVMAADAWLGGEVQALPYSVDWVLSPRNQGIQVNRK